MKLALVTSTLYGQGAEFVVAALARGFFEKGHEVEIWVCQLHADIQRQHPELKPFKTPDGVAIRVMPYRRARYNVLFMRNRIRRGRYDCVMCHASNYAIPMAIAAIGSKGRTKIVNVVHTGGIGTSRDGEIIEPTFTITGFVRRLLERNFDAQFSVSEGTVLAIHRMTGYPISRLYTVYNPVVDENFRQKLERLPQHPWLRDRTVPTFVAAGAFCRLKNYKMLLDAFARVRAKRHCRLVIFGKGALLSEYQDLVDRLGIAEFVDFPGYTNQLPAEMKNAAAFVVSSLMESFSVVLVEALAAGAPVVATDCPYGPGEILEGGKHGILVRNNDAEMMAEGLLKVLDGKSIRPDASCVARFTTEAVIARYEAALQQVMSQ